MLKNNWVYNVVMIFPIIVQHVKEHFMPHRLMLVVRWDAEVRIGGGRFTVLYDFPDEKLARSPVNKGVNHARNSLDL